jgi:hypothetical protein
MNWDQIVIDLVDILIKYGGEELLHVLNKEVSRRVSAIRPADGRTHTDDAIDELKKPTE